MVAVLLPHFGLVCPQNFQSCFFVRFFFFQKKCFKVFFAVFSLKKKKKQKKKKNKKLKMKTVASEMFGNRTFLNFLNF